MKPTSGTGNDPNVALYVVPVAIARALEKLDAVLASRAERPEQSTMAIRLSESAPWLHSG